MRYRQQVEVLLQPVQPVGVGAEAFVKSQEQGDEIAQNPWPHFLKKKKKKCHIFKVIKEGIVKGVMRTIKGWNSYLG